MKNGLAFFLTFCALTILVDSCSSKTEKYCLVTIVNIGADKISNVVLNIKVDDSWESYSVDSIPSNGKSVGIRVLGRIRIDNMFESGNLEATDLNLSYTANGSPFTAIAFSYPDNGSDLDTTRTRLVEGQKYLVSVIGGIATIKNN